jgi:large repetitive protein
LSGELGIDCNLDRLSVESGAFRHEIAVFRALRRGRPPLRFLRDISFYFHFYFPDEETLAMNAFGSFNQKVTSSRRRRIADTRAKRTRALVGAETLENRQLLAATLDINGVGALTYSGSGVNNNVSISDSATTGFGNYTISDTGETISLSLNAISLGWTGSGTNTVTGPDSSVNSMAVNVGPGSDTVNILSTTDPISVDTALGVPDTTNIGNAGSLSGIVADVFVEDTGGIGSLSVDDSADSAAKTINFNDGTITGSLPGGHAINYEPGITTLTFNGGSGGNTVGINLPTINSQSTLQLNTGSGDDSVSVVAVNAGLTLNLDDQGGTNAITLGDGSLTGLATSPNLASTGGTTSLTLDNSTSSTGQTVLFKSGLITGATANPITYPEDTVTFVTYKGGTGDDTLTANLVGNPALVTENLNGGGGVNAVDVQAVTATMALNVDTGSAGPSTVSVGAGGTLAGILGPVRVKATAGTTTMSLDDHSDTTNATATLDNLAGGSTPYEVTGLSPAPIEYGAGVTALNITGGTSAGGSAGVTYDINNTHVLTTTTITGGAQQNFFNLSNAGLTDGLDNLVGPVVVNGGASLTDAVKLEDSSADFNDSYVITDTTVGRIEFGGLTYGSIGTLTLNAENNLGTHGNNTININNTADSVTTNINGQGGIDTINVNSTGTGGVLNVSTGTVTGNTVNVIADNEPVNVSMNSLGSTDIINVGSTGGPGTMAGILGAIDITDPPGFFTLTFHDENDLTGHTWTLDNDDTNGMLGLATMALDGGIATTTYRPGDLTSPLTVDGGSGGNTFDVNKTTSKVATTLNTGTGADSVNVFGTGTNTLNIDGQDSADTVTLGASASAPLGMQGLLGTIHVTNDAGSTALVLDDSQDTTGQTASLTNNGTDGTVTGLAPATITYINSGISRLDVNGGSGGNTFNVNGTLVNASVVPTPTMLNKGTGANTVNVDATNAGSLLDLAGSGGPDAVTIGDGNLGTIQGQVNINEAPGSTNLTIDLSNDGLAHTLDLSSNGTTSTLHDALGNLPNDITYITASLASLTIDTSPLADEVLNVDFSGGNPIPTSFATGLIFNAGADFGNAFHHALNLLGTLPSGPFSSEIHNANDHSVFPQIGQYGSIFLTDSTAVTTGLNYTGILPINDTAPAVNYTFNDFADDQSFTASDGPTVLGFNTIQFADTPVLGTLPTFETTNVANKPNIVFNTPNSGVGLVGVVNVTTASTGLAALTFNTNTGGDNTVSFVATPPGVVTALDGGTEEDVTNVTGLGVSAGTTLLLNGGTSTNTLNYDAGGETPTVTAGAPGHVLITIPGAGTVDAVNYQQINITDVGPLTITPGAARMINSVEGFQLVDAIVGTFTLPIPASFPTPPAGLPSSDFTTSIDWGDPSVDATAGTITQDASNPSVYDITGTHTFVTNGTYTVANAVAFSGGTLTALVGGTPVSITYGPSGPTAGTSATASVTQGTLAVSAFPIVGVEGSAIAAGPIATFIDAGGADPIGDYSATITITDSTGAVMVSVPAASITQNGNAAEFTVNAPAFTLPEEGTYQVAVSVTDSDGAIAITVSGSSSAVVADAALTAGATVPQSVNTGIALSGIGVGTFTDANPGATVTDFTGTVDWGDGSPNSAAVFAIGALGFDVSGSHTYAKPGVYNVTTTVLDAGGATTVVKATFTVSDLPVTGATKSFTSVEGQNTGLFVLATFEDPNSLATTSDVKAALAIGGWGDGTPTVAGVTLVVQAIGVDPANGDPIFEVLGSNTYAEETPLGLPDTLSVIITTLGGATTTLTSPPGGGVTVLDAPLTPNNGTTIAGIEGNSTGTVFLGSFTDANPGATVADFTSGTGSVVVNWGDGSTPQTLAGANLTSVGAPNGVVFTISAVHTYAETGQYAITITVTDDGGATTVISSSAAIADAALTPAQSPALVATEGLPLANALVATFSDTNPLADPSDFSAIIYWADGTSSAGVVTETGLPGTPFVVHGTHTFLEETAAGSPLPVVVVVTDEDGNSTSTMAIPTLVTVNDAALTGTGVPVNGVEANALSNVPLASFTDANPSGTVSDFAATITWGDGTTSAGNIIKVGGNALGSTFQVIGSHTYGEEGSFPISVAINDVGGQATATTSTATIVDAPLAAQGTSIQGVEGNSTGPVLVATFTDANTTATIADYTVSVSWGDGTTSSATLSSIGAPNGTTFTVTGTHTYAETGSYQITTTITDAGGAATIANGEADVADALLSPGVGIAVTGTEGLKLVSVPVATFDDNNPLATPADFTATIDWGDGGVSSGGIALLGVSGGVAHFQVTGNHTYTDEGAYDIHVTVLDGNGIRVTAANTTATIGDAPLANGVGSNITFTESVPLVNVAVGQFADTNRFSSVSDFNATINWGDGTPSTSGLISLVGGTAAGNIFQVLGSHTYTEQGTFPISIVINDIGGSTLSINAAANNGGSAVGHDSGLAGLGTSIQGVEGVTTGPVIIGTFTDSDPNSTVADFTGPLGSIVVNWGDGNAPETLPSSTLAIVSTDSHGVTYSITAAHTCAEEGGFQIGVTVSDEGGAKTILHGAANIADASLTASPLQPTVAGTEAIILGGPVVAFLDRNPMGKTSDFQASIDWGDGTARTTGTISQPGGPGFAFLVTGFHTYADARVNGGNGSLNITVTITDDGGETLTVGNTASVADVPIALSGRLNPVSDTGESRLDGITDNNHPNFFGSSEPGSTVTLVASPVSGGAPEIIGQGTTNSDGFWSITSSTLVDASYNITAVAVDKLDETIATSVIVIGTGNLPLVIDTVGPKVTNMVFSRLAGQILVTFQDDRSGMNMADDMDAEDYVITKARSRPFSLLATALATTGGPTGPDMVAVTLNNGARLRGGRYLLDIRSNNISGIEDIAGNALDGEFYGFFPSGNNIPGGDFTAQLDAIHHKIFPPSTTIGTASPLTAPGTRPPTLFLPGNGRTVITPEARLMSTQASIAPPAGAVQDAALQALLSSGFSTKHVKKSHKK